MFILKCVFLHVCIFIYTFCIITYIYMHHGSGWLLWRLKKVLKKVSCNTNYRWLWSIWSGNWKSNISFAKAVSAPNFWIISLVTPCVYAYNTHTHTHIHAHIQTHMYLHMYIIYSYILYITYNTWKITHKHNTL